MARMPTDSTFHATSPIATDASSEELAYVALQSVGDDARPDAVGIVDTSPASSTYGRLVGRVEFPNGGNELHHVGWNACSSRHCACAPNAAGRRRYLIVPGGRSSRIHVRCQCVGAATGHDAMSSV